VPALFYVLTQARAKSRKPKRCPIVSLPAQRPAKQYSQYCEGSKRGNLNNNQSPNAVGSAAKGFICALYSNFLTTNRIFVKKFANFFPCVTSQQVYNCIGLQDSAERREDNQRACSTGLSILFPVLSLHT